MPTSAGDWRILRWLARLLVAGVALIAIGRLIDPEVTHG